MPTLRSGRQEGLPYSLSRWTDLPAAKWDWFKTQVDAGSMIALDPKTGFPDRWSLDPVDTLGMVFWTRNCQNLVKDADLLRPYQKIIHFSLTGWHEVELRAPGVELGLELVESAIATFGAAAVSWRFAPIPAVPDVLDRFARLASTISHLGLNRVYVSFLQDNDWQAETRTPVERLELLRQMAASTSLEVILCNEDRETLPAAESTLRRGICEDGSRFLPGIRAEACGCALAVDPFTQNEACCYGCRFCYAGNRATAEKKRNTTRLSLLRGRV